MMNSEKMTYVVALSYVLDNCNLPTDVSEKLTALRDAQTKKSTKPTKAQTEAAANAEIVFDALTACDAPVTVSELIASSDALAGMSGQRVSALLRKLMLDNKVERIEEKRVAKFRVA